MEDEGGHDPQGDAVDALGAEEHVVDDPRDRVAAVGEDVEARDVEEVGPEVAVDQHQHGDDRQRRADASPRPFQDEQEGEAPHDELGVIGASGPHADVVELEKDIDGDHAGHEREEKVEIGHVVLLVVDGFVPDEGIDRPDPLEEEQAQDGEKDPQQEDPPEDQRRVEVLEPGTDVQVRVAQPDPVQDKPDHGRVDGEGRHRGPGDRADSRAA